MEGILTYREVEGAYQAVKATGILTATYFIVGALAVVITIRKVLTEYWNGIVDSKDEITDVKKYFDLLKPLIPYVLFLSAFPFIISLVESLFALMEENLLGKIGHSPVVDFDEYLKGIEEIYINKNRPRGMLGMMSSQIMIEDAIDYIKIYIIAPIMLMIDNYIFSFAIAGRYVYLLMLEVVAPFAILGLMYKSTEGMFFTWFKNMMVCFLLVPSFMIANLFANKIFEILVMNSAIGLLLALKLTLYKVVKSNAKSLL